jgi:hypothetical protein
MSVSHPPAAPAEHHPDDLARDPVWQAAMNAPLDDETETEAERLAIEEFLRTYGAEVDGA